MKTGNLEKIAQIVGVPVKTLSAGIILKIRNAPHAQLRTSIYKKAVCVAGDFVYKGPYTDDDPQLMNNLRFTYATQILEEALHIPEWQRAALPWEYIGKWDRDCYYLVAPNIGKTKNIPYDFVTSKIETDVPVVPRGGAVWRVSEAEKNGQVTDDIKLSALQHLYLRYLLDIGDSGTHNILIRQDSNRTGRLVAGIDLEEQRKRAEKNTRLDHLFKKGPSKKQEQLYKPHVGQIIQLHDGQLDQCIIDQLSAVGIDLKRLRTNMEIWEALE